jgi:cytochrome P450
LNNNRKAGNSWQDGQIVSTGEVMRDQQLQDELITLYIARHDTTAILLGWAWGLLAQHESAAAQLTAE